MPEEIPAEVRDARRAAADVARQRARYLHETARSGQRLDIGRLTELDRAFADRLEGVAALIDPCDASPDAPLVLLPVRLETRYAMEGQSHVLKVRIYPDEIHVDDLVRGLSEEEVAAGQAYWGSIWADPVPETAFPALVAAVTPGRAEWVAHACRPVNVDQRGLAAPVFPDVLPRGARNVVARALPDRFVVLAIQDGAVHRAAGRPIPPDLPLTPLPMLGDDAPRSRDQLRVPPGSEWLIDFDRAVEVGMGVVVPLAGARPIERVVAVGARASADLAEGAEELEDLLVGHRYSGGLGLLAQGAPTNNADASRSPYRSRPTPVPPSLTPPAAAPGSDTTAAAAVLGIDPAVLASLVGDGFGEQAVAKAVNTALWAPGWGEFLSRLDSQGVPGVVDAQRESARQLFGSQVRGRGPAPALRVAAQPYGLLPASDLSLWIPRAGETTAGIVTVVRTLLRRWLHAADARVDRIRPGQAGIDDTLLEVMGASPVMQALRVRPVVTDDVSGALLAALGIDHREYEAERMSTAAVLSSVLAEDAAKATVGSLHRQTRPLPLPLASDRDVEFITALLGSPSRVLAVDSVLQALLALAWQSSDVDAAKSAPASVLPELIAAVELPSDLKAAAVSLAARGDSAATSEFAELAQRVRDVGYAAGGPSMLREFQPVEHLQTSLAEVALSAPAGQRTIEVAGAALAGWLLHMGYRAEVRDAMTALLSTTTSARALAVAETLDCSSHRLDAWATAVVADRRARQGAARGLTIGAYGVVEGLRPRQDPAADGWIHAPSTRHAIAAGLLRNAHLSHLPDGAGGGPFALDLSSVRLRSAVQAIDGVRQGQPLAALIGYQIERGLAAAGLARLQLSLRTIAPLVARRLSDADEADPDAAKEAIAANNVVDGLLLLDRHPPDDPRLRALLDVPPKNQYLEHGDWSPLTDPQWSAVTRVLAEAAETVDAVADVMLAESVLQHAGGNPTRAAAAMDAMGSGANPSDTIDVLETQDRADRLTHRVVVAVGGSAPSPWSPGRPRALAEPALERWAAACLGDPATVVLAEVDGALVTLDAADLAALDLVHAMSEAGLERSLRWAVPELVEAPLAVRRDPGWPAGHRSIRQVLVLAGTLRALIAGGTPLTPQALTRTGEQPSRDAADSRSELTARMTTLAASLTAAVAAAEPAIAALPPDGLVADEAAAQACRSAVAPLDAFGAPLHPNPDLPLDLSWTRAAWESAHTRAANASALVQALAALPVDADLTLVLDGAQAVAEAALGEGFLVVPVLPPATLGPDAFAAAVSAPAFPAPAHSALRRFVRDAGTVREQVRRHSELLLVAGALGTPRAPTVVQLTEREDTGAPAPGGERWLAGPLPVNGPWPASPAVHLVLDAVSLDAPEGPLAGLVVDAWVEDLPAQVGPDADPDDPQPGSATTGLAVRADSASARAPQAVLAAVSPDGRRWTADRVLGVVLQTLDLAKARLVRLDQLPGEGLILPALYTRSSSLQVESVLDFRVLQEASKLHTLLPFVKENAP